jgi:glycosyltransferase involved in cell wall biosynthesis
MSQPPVSICLLTYNRAHLLPSTIESLLGQTFSDFELIISDDCSDEETRTVCMDYERRDRRIAYYRNPERLMMPGNLNAAIERSRGDLVANLHDGDVYRPNLLEKWVNALNCAPGAAFVFNAYECIEWKTKKTKIERHDFPAVIPIRALTNRMMFDLTSPVWGTVMARRSSYDKVGLFNPRYGWYSDVEMWMRLNTFWQVCYIPEPLISLHLHEMERPYAKINWSHERILVAMHEETIDRVFADDPVQGARALQKLRRTRDRRWLMKSAICLKQRNFYLLSQAAAVLLAEDRLLCKVAGAAAWTAGRLLSRENPISKTVIPNSDTAREQKRRTAL